LTAKVFRIFIKEDKEMPDHIESGGTCHIFGTALSKALELLQVIVVEEEARSHGREYRVRKRVLNEI